MLKEIKILEVVSVIVAIVTVSILWMQFQEQKKLWDVQARLHSLEIEQKS